MVEGSLRRGGTSIKAAIRDILETILLTAVIFFSVHLVVQTFRVEGQSMEPSFHTDEYLLVSKLTYMVGAPHRGDVVIFRLPQDPQRDLIKRVVALPGEDVEVSGGRVYINGHQLDEPYIREMPSYTYTKARTPPNDYFVLGDNRNNSSDSHVWGWLPKQYLIGKAWISYWPMPLWGTVRQDGARLSSEATRAA